MDGWFLVERSEEGEVYVAGWGVDQDVLNAISDDQFVPAAEAAVRFPEAFAAYLLGDTSVCRADQAVMAAEEIVREAEWEATETSN